nr:choice-of-anchor X domain-containing protein [Pseudomarimonas arenosa]
MCAAAFPLKAEELLAKQLAGPPEEFSAMQRPAIAEAPIMSKSAVVPMELSAKGSSWSTRLPAENGQLKFAVVNPGAAPLELSLQGPNGQQISASQMSARSKRSGIFEGGVNLPAEMYELNVAGDGEWQLNARGSSKTAGRALLILEGDPDDMLASWQANDSQKVKQPVLIAASLLSDADAGLVGPMAQRLGRLQQAKLSITAPNGDRSEVPMFDDGQHADGLAGDGVFGGRFLPKQAGNHLVQVVAHGRAAAGHAVLRTAEHVVPVLDSDLQLGAAGLSVSKSGEQRVQISLPVATAKNAGHFRTYAEVWGHNAAGEPVAVAWIGGMSALSKGQLTLNLDQRWLDRSGAGAPFELRNLRIEDPDHFVVLAKADSLALPLQRAASKAAGDIQIDDEMRQGPRPVAFDSAKGTGSRLLLVHGYCSGGVWPTSHFSNASTFLDANKSRSHDQFAQLIKSFGNTWNSYGVVAHSQGGAAALHLYTYYWSGLDNAGSGRLIQSVGTPYQGTNLAGILATLGSWFGVGCGTNDNLTYSGASSWLSGIPTSSRAKVNYYTTSFKSTNWWTNDYCNFATDLVLSDPEDGTTEKAKGQLSGAVNRGHTNGQCHTTGMRDPAQYKDSSRNATMNSNAAR